VNSTSTVVTTSEVLRIRIEPWFFSTTAFAKTVQVQIQLSGRSANYPNDRSARTREAGPGWIFLARNPKSEFAKLGHWFAIL
jgi:hypothetical protein